MYNKRFSLVQIPCTHSIITMQWVIFVGGDFPEKLEKAPRIKFHGLKYCGVVFDPG